MTNITTLKPITTAYVAIGVIHALNALDDATRVRIIESHQSELHLVQAAIDDAARQGIDGASYETCHAYDVAEPFGEAFVGAELNRLGEG